jgi:hypothetical protein
MIRIQDVDVIAEVIERAIAGHRQVIEARIEERTQACVSAERAVELARDAVNDVEDRLSVILQQRTTEAVDAMRHAATAELARQQDLLLRRLNVADELTDDLEALRKQLAELTPKDGASAYDLAVADGFDGSRTDWLVSLRGASGIDGCSPAADVVAEVLAEMPTFREQVRGGDGAGIAAPQWAPGIHRQDSVVQAYFGQYFRALRDTSAEPYASDDWQRIGSAGFHLAEPWAEGRTYRPGDLFVRDFGLFAWTAEGAQLLVGRGRPGDKGAKGERGSDGKDGRDGAGFDSIEMRGSVLALLMRNADGKLVASTADLMPMLKALGESLEERLFERLVQHFGGRT